MDKFYDAVCRILDSWTALELSVIHEMGRPQGLLAAQRLSLQIFVLFDNNKYDISCEYLENFLANIMNKDFNTKCEDGSIEEVAYLIQLVHESLMNENYVLYEKTMASVPKECRWFQKGACSNAAVPTAFSAASASVHMRNEDLLFPAPASSIYPISNSENDLDSSMDVEFSGNGSSELNDDDEWMTVPMKRRRY